MSVAAYLHPLFAYPNTRFDLDRPAEVDDDYWEKTEQHEEITQPAGTVSLLSFFTHYHKLMDIAAAVQKIIVCCSIVFNFIMLD